MNRLVLAIFLLVNYINLVSTASVNQELQSADNDRLFFQGIFNTLKLLQTITNFSTNVQNMMKNMISSIVNSVKNVINRVKNIFQTIIGQTTTTTTTSAPTTTASTTTTSASSSTTSATASIAPKESICMNQLGVQLPCSQVSVPYCWTKFPCNSDFPPGLSSTPKPVVTYTTTAPDIYTDNSVDIDGKKAEGHCMDVNENWLPCSQVSEPYCYYTHPC